MRVPPRDASGFLQTPLSKAPRHYAEALRFAFSRRGTSDKVLAFYVKLIGDEGKRCAVYRLLFARRFPKRALSSRRRAVRERVTNSLAPIATLALPSYKESFVQRGPAKQLHSLLQAQSGDYLRNGLFALAIVISSEMPL